MALALVIGLTLSAFFISATLISLAYIKLCWRRRDPVDLERPPVSEPLPTKGELRRRFGWPEIESLTGNFAPESVIGSGGFSTVYLALLPGPTQTFAALKVHRSSERLHRAFRQELDVLLRIRHPHIVRLLGYSDDPPADGALALEYVPGGTLHDRLHGTVALPWSQRMWVAYRVAGAVEYLHEGCDPQVVHGDIKAANVLLDGRMDPKLCDFGSSTMGFSAAVRSSAAEKTTMTGSPGYVDPHYLRTGMVSKKSDVYSFGVLLLELVTGAEAFCLESERSLTMTIGPLLKDGRAAEVTVDPRLGEEFDTAEAASVAELAACCVGEQPSLRPSMAEVMRIFREKVPSSVSGGEDDDRADQKPEL